MGRDRSRLPLRQFSAGRSKRGIHATAPACRATGKADYGAHSRGGRGYGEHTQGRSSQGPQGAVVILSVVPYGPRPRKYCTHGPHRYTFIVSPTLQNSDSAYWITSPTCTLVSPVCSPYTSDAGIIIKD